MSGTTRDRLLGGRVLLDQPATGYRAAIDPVLLAAGVPARAGETVLEAGLGAGAAALCLLARVPDASVTGIELDAALAALARGNAALNGCAGRLAVIEGDILALRQGRFAHAMANPPYQPHGSGSVSPHAGRARADREAAADALEAWIAALARRLEARGSLSLVLPAARLSQALAGCRAAGIGAIAVLPVAPRAGEAAGRAIIQGRKSARGPDRLLAPLVLHQADGSFTEAAERVLREGAAISI
jgi:tRNA1(Val) A37 N6-methylase TrmN6